MVMSQVKDNCIVEIEKINLSNNVLRKLDVIGIYVGAKIFINSLESTKYIVIFEINNIKYGIRRNDAEYIVVKKEKM